MKFLMFVAGAAVVIIIFLSVRVSAMRMTCNRQFRPEIDRLVSQSHGVFGDRHKMCEASYGTIIEWDTCFADSDAVTPKQLRDVMQPVVAVFMALTQNDHSEMKAIKEEHDNRCREYPSYLFDQEAN